MSSDYERLSNAVNSILVTLEPLTTGSHPR